MSEIQESNITYQEKIYNDENQSTITKIYDLSRTVDTGNPDVSDILEKTSHVSINQEDIQKRTISRLANTDENTKEIVGKLNILSYSLREWKEKKFVNFTQADVSRFKDADELLQRYLQSSATRQLPLPLQDLAHINNRYLENKIKKSEEIYNLCNNPEVVWTELVRQGVVTQQYLDEIEQVQTLLEMSRKLQIIQSASNSLPKNQLRAIRAKVFLPYIMKDDPLFKEYVNPILIDEIVEDRFDMGNEFTAGLLEMFTIINQESRKPGLTFQQKAVRAVLIASIIATGVLANSDNTLNMIEPNYSYAQYEQLSNELPPPFEESKATRNEKNISEVSDLREEDSDSEDDNRDDSIKSYMPIENSDRLGKGKEKAQWNLDGKDLGGFFKTDFASDFTGYGRYSWSFDYTSPTEVISIQKNPISEKSYSDIEITKSYRILPKKILLPKKYGYAVNPSSIAFTIDGRIVDPTAVYLNYESNGGNSLNIAWYNLFYDLSKSRVKVTYGLIKETDENNQWRPIPRAEHKEKFADVSKMPNDVFGKYQSIMRTNTSPLKQMKEFEKWIKTDFTYSLNSKYSDYYQRAETSNEFMERMFNKKHTDCDVANTALIFLARNAGIPTRMAVGYNNDDSFLFNKDKNKLVKTEAHGWVEAYIDGRWMTFDATPIAMDDYTAEMLKGNGYNVPNPLKSSLPESLEEALLMWEIFKDSPSYRAVLGLTELGGLGLLYAFLLRKRFKQLSYARINSLTAHSMAKGASKKLGVNPDNLSSTEKFFDYYLEKRTTLSQEHPNFYVRNLNKLGFMLFADHGPFAYKSSLRDFLKRVREAKPAERASELQTRLENSNVPSAEIDPMDIFVEIAGYDRKDVDIMLRRRNLYKIFSEFDTDIRESAFASLDPTGEDYALMNRLVKRFCPIDLYYVNNQPDPDWHHKYLGFLRRIKLDKYTENLVADGVNLYNDEYNLREKAKSIEENRRNKKQQKLANRPDLSLSEDEVKKILNEEVVRPFAVMWHLANS